MYDISCSLHILFGVLGFLVLRRYREIALNSVKRMRLATYLSHVGCVRVYSTACDWFCHWFFELIEIRMHVKKLLSNYVSGGRMSAMIQRYRHGSDQKMMLLSKRGR